MSRAYIDRSLYGRGFDSEPFFSWRQSQGFAQVPAREALIWGIGLYCNVDDSSHGAQSHLETFTALADSLEDVQKR